VRHHSLHPNPQRAADEPGKKCENHRKQERALQRGGIGHSSSFNLIEEVHDWIYSVLVLPEGLASIGKSAASVLPAAATAALSCVAN